MDSIDHIFYLLRSNFADNLAPEWQKLWTSEENNDTLMHIFNVVQFLHCTPVVVDWGHLLTNWHLDEYLSCQNQLLTPFDYKFFVEPMKFDDMRKFWNYQMVGSLAPVARNLSRLKSLGDLCGMFDVSFIQDILALEDNDVEMEKNQKKGNRYPAGTKRSDRGNDYPQFSLSLDKWITNAVKLDTMGAVFAEWGDYVYRTLYGKDWKQKLKPTVELINGLSKALCSMWMPYMVREQSSIAKKLAFWEYNLCGYGLVYLERKEKRKAYNGCEFGLMKAEEWDPTKMDDAFGRFMCPRYPQISLSWMYYLLFNRMNYQTHQLMYFTEFMRLHEAIPVNSANAVGWFRFVRKKNECILNSVEMNSWFTSELNFEMMLIWLSALLLRYGHNDPDFKKHKPEFVRGENGVWDCFRKVAKYNYNVWTALENGKWDDKKPLVMEADRHDHRHLCNLGYSLVYLV